MWRHHLIMSRRRTLKGPTLFAPVTNMFLVDDTSAAAMLCDMMKVKQRRRTPNIHSNSQDSNKIQEIHSFKQLHSYLGMQGGMGLRANGGRQLPDPKPLNLQHASDL